MLLNLSFYESSLKVKRERFKSLGYNKSFRFARKDDKQGDKVGERRFEKGKFDRNKFNKKKEEKVNAITDLPSEDKREILDEIKEAEINDSEIESINEGEDFDPEQVEGVYVIHDTEFKVYENELFNVVTEDDNELCPV